MGGITGMMGKASAELRRKQANKGKRPAVTGVDNARTRGNAKFGLSHKKTTRGKPALLGRANAATRGRAGTALNNSSLTGASGTGLYSKLGGIFSSVKKKKKRKKRRRLLG